MSKTLRIMSLFLVVLLLSTTAYAASPWTEKTTYKDKVLGKLEFGVKNTLGGWTELISRPIKAKNKFVGVAEGLGNAVVYTLGGILHLITFPIPQIDIPLPNNGVSLE